MSHAIEKVAIAGIPNCGKTTLFNAITGARQRVGNWPGVTVEKVEGSFRLKGETITLVDLPGTYNLTPDTEDQRVAERVIREGEYDFIINVVDATNLSRNLYLTMDLKERTNQLIVLLNMVDVAKKEGIEVDAEKLSERLGVPVIPVSAVDKKMVDNAIKEVEKFSENLPEHNSHPTETEVLGAIEKYALIDEICGDVSRRVKDKNHSFTARVDRVILNKWLSVPVFLAAMFATFWFAVSVGSAFIDFFDITGGLFFVDMPAAGLDAIGMPAWLTTIVTSIGTGIQTVMTFIPVVFFMFIALAILEDLGYMARVGVIADRLMRKIGLPGSAFIPMIVGFGCTVPAVMSARTLTTKRDRFMTIFMAPFMSCGARLPVYALFCASIFGGNSGMVVFLIYVSGLIMAIFTGFMLKNTLFRGVPSNFVIDLPLYHTPRIGAVLKSAWVRLKSFLKKAGTIVVVAVGILNVFNTVGIEDNQLIFNTEDPEATILAYAGKAVTPIFEPFGVKKENWPAGVALFTGLFAKEAIVGTVNSLYATMDAHHEKIHHEKLEKVLDTTPEPLDSSMETDTAPVEDEEGLDIPGTLMEAIDSVKEGLLGVVSSADLLGIGLIGEDKEAVAEEIGASNDTYSHIAKNFTAFSAFAYLLFVLMYFPCLAVIGAARKEMGGFFTTVLAVYATLLGWAVATLFYQIAEGHNIVYLIVSIAILLGIYGGLYLLGERERAKKTVGLAPPVV